MWACVFLLGTRISKNYSDGVDGFGKGPPSSPTIPFRKHGRVETFIIDVSEQRLLTDSFLNVHAPIFPWLWVFLSWCHVQNFRTIAFIVSTQRPLKAEECQILPFSEPAWTLTPAGTETISVIEKGRIFLNSATSNLFHGPNRVFLACTLPPLQWSKKSFHQKIILSILPNLSLSISHSHTTSGGHVRHVTIQLLGNGAWQIKQDTESETANELRFYIGCVSQYTSTHITSIHTNTQLLKVTKSN